MTTGEDLYRLQRLDSERDKKQHRLDDIEATLGESEELQQARQALNDAEERVREWTRRRRDLELEAEGLSDRISNSEKRLYSGKVNSPKELSDLQTEIAALKRRRQKLEDKLLDTMIEQEEASEAQAEAEEHLEDVESRWSTQQANLRAEREELRTRLEEIEQERKTLLPNIEEDTLSQYQNLRERKGGRAVVRLNDNVCNGCGVAISPSLEWQLRQGKLIHCDNCGRIIVRT